jgi:hypothetical protein
MGERMMIARTLVTAVATTLMLSFSGIGRSQLANDNPVFKPGDSWEFLRTDAKDGKSSNWMRTVVAVESPERIAVKWETGAIEYYDSALNWLPRGSDARVLVRYPIRVDDEWTFSLKSPNPNYMETGNAKVTRSETIEVPAGTFECYRIDFESTWGSIHWSQHRIYSRWYCPKIKWIAKEVVMTKTRDDYNPAGNGVTTVTSVLVKYTPGL